MTLFGVVIFSPQDVTNSVDTTEPGILEEQIPQPDSNASSSPINSRLNVMVRSPTLFELGRNSYWPPRGLQLPPCTPLTQTIFLLCYTMNKRRKIPRSLFEIGRLLFLFSCFFLARLLILLLFLLSRNVYSNPGTIFSCLVFAGNVTWRGRLVQCCTCSKYFYLRCSVLFFSRFKTLGSSHCWSCSSCCVPASSKNPTPTNTSTSSSDFSSLYISTVLFLAHLVPSANAVLPPHPRLQISSVHVLSSSTVSSPLPQVSGFFYYLLLSFPH